MRLTGFEPAAFRVGAERSIQLSYNRTSMEKHRRDVFRLKNLWSVHRQTAGGICAADRQRRNLLCRFVLPRRAWSTQYDAFSGRMRLCRADGPPVSFIITHPAQKINRILQKVPGSRASGADGPRRVPFARWGPYASRLGGNRFGRTGAGPGAFRPPCAKQGACGRSGPGRSVNRGAAAAPRPRGTFRTAGAKAAWMPVQAQRRLRGGWRRSGSGRCAPSGLRALPCPAGHFCLGGCFLAGAAGVLSGASSPGSVPFCSSPPFSRDSSRAQA